MTSYDALLLVSFGGPESPDEVMPFLERVTAGRGVPRERLEAVSHDYLALGGVSPINDQNRALLAASARSSTGVTSPSRWRGATGTRCRSSPTRCATSTRRALGGCSRS